ncbi:hypothetical protein MP228_008366 [Amoeboaphelidium protococcarum]|nr:hypothetical protein MP228_008366 [Amoeboaphelidium protococcarum]
MGLCKHRKVTNLFCFKHKKNVCELCLVEDATHQYCVVKSYLEWLQDSDAADGCRICNKPFADGDSVIRLTCLDVLHLDCLNQEFSKILSSDNVEHFKCPCCQAVAVPSQNAAGPLANQVKWILYHSPGAEWSRQFIKDSPPQPVFSSSNGTQSRVVETSIQMPKSSSSPSLSAGLLSGSQQQMDVDDSKVKYRKRHNSVSLESNPIGRYFIIVMLQFQALYRRRKTTVIVTVLIIISFVVLFVNNVKYQKKQEGIAN